MNTYYCPKCNTGWKEESVRYPCCPVCGSHRSVSKVPTPFVHYDPPSTRTSNRKSKWKSAAKIVPKLAKRDGWVCHLCGLPVDPQAEGPMSPTVDHLKPVSKGGTRAMKNLKLAHKVCNNSRGNRPLGGRHGRNASDAKGNAGARGRLDGSMEAEDGAAQAG